MKQFILSVVAALATDVMAETVNTVTVTKFNQSYPYTGKATVEYTVDGPLPANAVAKITLSEDGTSATFTQENVVAGANTAGYAVSVVESSDVAGETVTATKPLDATGRTEFATGSAASRFYRLSATPGNAE